MAYVLVVLGIALLVAGGELLVRNASGLSQRWGVTPLVIGLTVVAFGTSAPEVAASVTAALQGADGLSLGNVIGSNVINILLILGLTAVISPLVSNARFLRRELPIMIGSAVLLLLLMLDGRLAWLEGLLFLALLVGYLWWMFRSSDDPEVEAEFAVEYTPPEKLPPLWMLVLGAAAGIALLVFGAQALVTGAVDIAEAFGLSDLLIGLTVVAIGTSLPELAASVAAALKRESDIALGNIVGSNIFNILSILGITAVVTPLDVPFQVIAVDLYVMIGVSILLPLLLLRHRLTRASGAFMLLLYVAYTTFLVMATT